MSITQAMRDRAKKFENNIPHLYLDTKGNATVGVGKMLPNANAAAALPFIKKSDSTAASTQEKKDDWTAVKAQPAGHVASFYDQHTKLKLKPADIDAILDADLTSFEKQLRNEFKEYDTFPAAAQEGLMDMVFNLGIGTLTSKFVKFCDAVRAKDWKKAGAESSRTGVSADRNSETKALFESAAPPAPLFTVASETTPGELLRRKLRMGEEHCARGLVVEHGDSYIFDPNPCGSGPVYHVPKEAARTRPTGRTITCFGEEFPETEICARPDAVIQRIESVRAADGLTQPQTVGPLSGRALFSTNEPLLSPSTHELAGSLGAGASARSMPEGMSLRAESHFSAFSRSGKDVERHEMSLLRNTATPQFTKTTNPILFELPAGTGTQIVPVHVGHGASWEVSVAVLRSDGSLIDACNNNAAAHGVSSKTNGFFIPLPLGDPFPAAARVYKITCHFKRGEWRPDLPWEPAVGVAGPNYNYAWWIPEDPKQWPEPAATSKDGWAVTVRIGWP